MKKPAMGVTAVILLGSAATMAETTKPGVASPPASTSAAPLTASAPSPPGDLADVVRTKDGSIVRGTIVEKATGKHVDLRTASGEMRRFAWNEVTYAGPFAEDKGADAARVANLVTIQATRPHNVYVSETETHGTGQDRTSTMGWRRLCTAPCQVELQPGRYKLGLAPGETVLPVEGTTTVNPGGVLEATVKDRSHLRIAGAITIPTALVIGGALAWTGLSKECSSRDLAGKCLSEDYKLDATGGIGATIAVVGFLVGVGLLVQQDVAEVRTVSGARGRLSVGVGPGSLGASGSF